MNDELEGLLDEMDEFIRRAIDAEMTSQTIEMLSGMTIEQVVEGFRDGTFEPKQELPVLPRYMHEWIMNHRDKYDLYPALKRLEGNPLGWERFYTWYRENTHEFVNAYLTGEYKVEEEPLYYALIKGHELLADHDALSFTYWNFNMSNGYLLHGNKFSKQVRFLTKMTKEDWNKLGINDSNADFVRVDNNQDNYLTNKDNTAGGNT